MAQEKDNRRGRYLEARVNCAAAEAAYEQLRSQPDKFKALTELGPGLLARIRGRERKGIIRETALIQLMNIKNFADRCNIPHEALLAKSSEAASSPPQADARRSSADVEEQRVGIETRKTIESGCFEASTESNNGRAFLKYSIRASGTPLRFSDIFDLWFNPVFVDFYISLFKQSGYYGYTWETPAISNVSVDRKFEFVIHSLPKSSGRPDRTTYAEYFDTHTSPDGIVSFKNLGGDALLIVPSPFRQDADYSGLAEFFRDAPINQQRGLWRELGRHAKSGLCDRPMWLSVASGGIHWLHFRIDSVPKYYRYEPYT